MSATPSTVAATIAAVTSTPEITPPKKWLNKGKQRRCFGDPRFGDVQDVLAFETFTVSATEEASDPFRRLVASGQIVPAPIHDPKDIRSLEPNDRFFKLVRDAGATPGHMKMDPLHVERVLRHSCESYGARLSWEPNAKMSGDAELGGVAVRYLKRMTGSTDDVAAFDSIRKYLAALCRQYEKAHGPHSLGFSRAE